MNGEAVSEPTALAMLEQDLGVGFTCGTVRDASCPGSPSVTDLSACIKVDPVGGDFVGNSGPNVVVLAGNGCPNLRSFDLLGLQGAPTNATGNEQYTSLNKGALQYHSVSNSRVGGPDYQTVIDGGSVHYRSDAGTCLDAQTFVTERVSAVMTWFGYAGAGQDCEDPTTGLDVFDDRDRRPSGFVTALAAGRPNPFQGRGVVTLGFSMSTKGHATLEVFDVNGRLVKTVVDDIFEAGNEHQVTWDGTDNGGSSVASGVYFYRLKANGTEFAKKLVVVRNGN
jgi:hypothetical protein